MSKIYYKVVTENLKSIWVSHLIYISNNRDNSEYNQLVVQYKLNQWVYPNSQFNGSKLMVFDNLISAKRFRLDHGGTIYECEVKNPKRSGLFVYTARDFLLRGLVKQLELRKQRKKFNIIVDSSVPYGTVFCNAVKLIKQVQVH